jgi:hypothetical protein
VTEVARQEGRFWAEALMYRCHPQVARVLHLIADGAVGEVLHVRAALGWGAKPDPASRVVDVGLGGGGILDVGTYPVSLARLVAGAAVAAPFADPETVVGTGALFAPDGADAGAWASCASPRASRPRSPARCAAPLDNTATITGTAGSIVLDDPWTPGRDAGPSDATIRLRRDGAESVEVLRHPEQLFVWEARMATAAVAEGRTEASPPAATHADSVGQARTLDRWRAALGYKVASERAPRVLPGVLPPGLPSIPTVEVAGRPVSSLVMGCDNRDTLAEGAVVWDAYWEAGGRAFDTAHIYGGGRHERVLGEWLALRGVANEATVVVKGAHSPYCLPGAVTPELDRSLDRLGLDRAPLYVLHRDNEDVPVGEFVEALDALVRLGRVGAWGGSNWTPARLRAARGLREGAQGSRRPVSCPTTCRLPSWSAPSGRAASIPTRPKRWRGWPSARSRTWPGRRGHAATSCPRACATACRPRRARRPASAAPPTPSAAARAERLAEVRGTTGAGGGAGLGAGATLPVARSHRAAQRGRARDHAARAGRGPDGGRARLARLASRRPLTGRWTRAQARR